MLKYYKMQNENRSENSQIKLNEAGNYLPLTEQIMDVFESALFLFDLNLFNG